MPKQHNIPNANDPLPFDESDESDEESMQNYKNVDEKQKFISEGIGNNDITENSNNNNNNNNNNIFKSLNQMYVNGCPCGQPLICFFHLFFKVASLLVYLLLNLFINNFVLVFILCILLNAFDFWTVKNITGRKLVGLRWWNEIKEDGSSSWRFENKSETKKVHRIDKLIFWSAMYFLPIIWILFSIINFIKFSFSYLIVILFSLILSCFNLYGYIKCSRTDTSKEIRNFIVEKGLLQTILSTVFGTGDSSSLLNTNTNTTSSGSGGGSSSTNSNSDSNNNDSTTRDNIV
jgi:hypothetical protein